MNRTCEFIFQIIQYQGIRLLCVYRWQEKDIHRDLITLRHTLPLHMVYIGSGGSRGVRGFTPSPQNCFCMSCSFKIPTDLPFEDPGGCFSNSDGLSERASDHSAYGQITLEDGPSPGRTVRRC